MAANRSPGFLYRNYRKNFNILLKILKVLPNIRVNFRSQLKQTTNTANINFLPQLNHKIKMRMMNLIMINIEYELLNTLFIENVSINL